MKLTVPKTNVQPSVGPDKVAQLTGGTQVHPVTGGVLHTLQDPDLPGGVVAVVDGDAGPLWLSITADVTLWRHAESWGGAECRRARVRTD